MIRAFASPADLKPRKITFRRFSANCYAFTAEGDPNSGVIVGDDGVMVIDTQATPLMARAYDEARGIKHSRIWSAKRDLEL